MITLSLNNNDFRGRMLPIVQSARNPRAVMAGVGREGSNLLKKHFITRDQNEPNKLGGKREHFWKRVQMSVNNGVVDSSGLTVAITIADPRFAQKLFGGVITAKRAKNLAIPQSAEAYGRAPAVFDQEMAPIKLFLLKQRGKLFLAADVGAGHLVIEYLLTPSVNQQADPAALPDMEQFKEALVVKAQEITDRQAATGGGTIA